MASLSDARKSFFREYLGESLEGKLLDARPFGNRQLMYALPLRTSEANGQGNNLSLAASALGGAGGVCGGC